LAIAYIDLAVVSTESGTCVFLQNCWYMMSPAATVNDIALRPWFVIDLHTTPSAWCVVSEWCVDHNQQLILYIVLLTWGL
jgi:hypothetical protein